MYIDTCLSEELINNTSQTTGLSIDTLLDAYIKSNIDCHEGKSHDLERAMNQFFVIISRFSENISKINEVCLHHISRRLEGSDNGNNSCLGLHELLTEDNLFSRFLLDFGIEFKKSNIGPAE